MKRFAILLLFVLVLVAAPFVNAQTAVPLGGVGSLQFFANDGTLLTQGYVYLFQPGTSTAIPVYIDSTATTQQPNPVPLAAGARASIWLPTGSIVKVVLCAQNDGAACNGNDSIFSADNVLIAGGGSGSGSCGSGCTGFFISSSANPSTSGVLRCSSGDQCIAFRNQANSGNLPLTKDVNDVFSWPSAIKMPAVGTPSGLAAGFSHIWNDNTANRWRVSNNGAAAANLVVSGVDISTSDGVTALHAGATQLPISSTPPSTNQFICWNGTNLLGCGGESNITWSNPNNTLCGGNVTFNTLQTSNGCGAYWYWNNVHTITRLKVRLSTSGAGCTTLPVVSVVDVTSSSNLANITISNGMATFDSGALSISTTAAHDFGIGGTTASSGCTTAPVFSNFEVTYQ